MSAIARSPGRRQRRTFDQQIADMNAKIAALKEREAPEEGRQNGSVDADALLTYVINNAGQRGEQIAEAVGTDSGTIRPVMKRLIADGRVRTKGQTRDDLRGGIAGHRSVVR